MLKNIYRLIGLSGGIALVSSMLLLSESILQLSSEYTSANIFVFGFFLSIALIAGFCMNEANKKFDSQDGDKAETSKVGRWLHMALFLGLLFVALYLISSYSVMQEDAGMYTDDGNTNLLFILLILFTGVYYFVVRMVPQERRRRFVGKMLRFGVNKREERFSMLVLSVKPTDETYQTFELVGIVTGKIYLHQTAYVSMNDYDEPLECTIDKILVKDQVIRNAHDQQAKIIVRFDYAVPQLTRLSVLSNYHTVAKDDWNHLENPILRNYISHYTGMHESADYINHLLWCLAHTKFLVAAHCEEVKEDAFCYRRMEDDTAVFPSVAPAGKQEVKILPLFTDWLALNQWSMMIDDPKAVTYIFEFSALGKFIDAGFEGFVVNPFSSHRFYCPKELIQSLLKTLQEENTKKEEKHEERKDV